MKLLDALNTRWLFLALAYVLTGLAIIGIVLPIFPTTPFLIAAAWAAARGSTRFHHALVTNRYFGPMIRDWENQRAISKRAKLTGSALLIPSWLSVTYFSGSVYLSVATAILFAIIAAFILTRPTPERDD